MWGKVGRAAHVSVSHGVGDFRAFCRPPSELVRVDHHLPGLTCVYMAEEGTECARCARARWSWSDCMGRARRKHRMWSYSTSHLLPPRVANSSPRTSAISSPPFGTSLRWNILWKVGHERVCRLSSYIKSPRNISIHNVPSTSMTLHRRTHARPSKHNQNTSAAPFVFLSPLYRILSAIIPPSDAFLRGRE